MRKNDVIEAVCGILRREFKHALCSACTCFAYPDECRECYHPDSKWEAAEEVLISAAIDVVDTVREMDDDQD